MSKNEKNYKEQVSHLENTLKNLVDVNAKLLKEKKLHQNSVDYLKREIELREKEIMNKIRILYNKEVTPGKVEGSKNQTNKNKSNHSTIEEAIRRIFALIQKNYNMNIHEKLKSRMEVLLSVQKQMKVSYVIIKKLDIKEEFLRQNRLNIHTELFENMKSISKIGKLNFTYLRPCGPILIFRVIENTTFHDLKKYSCDSWNINISNYSLYDDAFNNMDCCINTKLIDFFLSYEAYDNSLKSGEVCFYIFEKIKFQTSLLDSQINSIEIKSASKEEEKENKANSGNCDFSRCMDLLRGNRILKGLESYNVKKADKNESFRNAVTMVDNYLIFILISTLLIVL